MLWQFQQFLPIMTNYSTHNYKNNITSNIIAIMPMLVCFQNGGGHDEALLDYSAEPPLPIRSYT